VKTNPMVKVGKTKGGAGAPDTLMHHLVWHKIFKRQSTLYECVVDIFEHR
jgi:hypothetical protein